MVNTRQKARAAAQKAARASASSSMKSASGSKAPKAQGVSTQSKRISKPSKKVLAKSPDLIPGLTPEASEDGGEEAEDAILSLLGPGNNLEEEPDKAPGNCAKRPAVAKKKRYNDLEYMEGDGTSEESGPGSDSDSDSDEEVAGELHVIFPTKSLFNFCS